MGESTQWHSVPQLAKVWRVHQSTVYNWIEEGLLLADQFDRGDGRTAMRVSDKEAERFTVEVRPHVGIPGRPGRRSWRAKVWGRQKAKGSGEGRTGGVQQTYA